MGGPADWIIPEVLPDGFWSKLMIAGRVFSARGDRLRGVCTVEFIFWNPAFAKGSDFECTMRYPRRLSVRPNPGLVKNGQWGVVKLVPRVPVPGGVPFAGNWWPVTLRGRWPGESTDHLMSFNVFIPGMVVDRYRGGVDEPIEPVGACSGSFQVDPGAGSSPAVGQSLPYDPALGDEGPVGQSLPYDPALADEEPVGQSLPFDTMV